MARFKLAIKKIDSIADIDSILKEIGLAERELEAIDSKAQREIIAIREKAIKDGELLRNIIQELSIMVGSYAEQNRNTLFSDKKSMDLTFGTFGFRKSTSIQVKKSTLELLKRYNMDKFIRIKEEVNRELMSELDDETLTKIDSFRKVNDNFFCDTNREEINRIIMSNSGKL